MRTTATFKRRPGDPAGAGGGDRDGDSGCGKSDRRGDGETLGGCDARNAGGGRFNGSIESAKENLLKEFKKQINT